MIQKLMAWLIGKKIMTAAGPIDAASKAKIVAVIGVLLPIVEPFSTAVGHPIHVPAVAYKILAAAGLWSVRDAIKPPAA